MTRANPKLTLTKEHIQKTKRGNIRKYQAAIKAKEKHHHQLMSNLKHLASLLSPLHPKHRLSILLERAPGKPITRRDVPTCLDFGHHRRILSGAHFCQPCDWYKQEVMVSNHCYISHKSGSRSSCQCAHSSFEELAGADCLPSIPINLTNNQATIPPTRYKLYSPKVLLKQGLSSLSKNSKESSSSSLECDDESHPNETITVAEDSVCELECLDSKLPALLPLHSVKRNLLYGTLLSSNNPVVVSTTTTSPHDSTTSTTGFCGSVLSSPLLTADTPLTAKTSKEQLQESSSSAKDTAKTHSKEDTTIALVEPAVHNVDTKSAQLEPSLEILGNQESNQDELEQSLPTPTPLTQTTKSNMLPPLRLLMPKPRMQRY